jgi:hypothetical protein
MQGNPVMPHHHLARYLGMNRICVIQQRWAEQGKAGIKKQPQPNDGEKNLPLAHGAIVRAGFRHDAKVSGERISG